MNLRQRKGLGRNRKFGASHVGANASLAKGVVGLMLIFKNNAGLAGADV